MNLCFIFVSLPQRSVKMPTWFSVLANLKALSSTQHPGQMGGDQVLQQSLKTLRASDIQPLGKINIIIEMREKLSFLLAPKDLEK